MSNFFNQFPLVDYAFGDEFNNKGGAELTLELFQDLTAYVKEAGTNEEMYNKFHEWRENGVNKQFCNLLKTNINSIACRMCEKVREKKESKTVPIQNILSLSLCITYV